jgi:transposase
MRRLHLRERDNILKRLLIHVGGFNLSLMMRKLIGNGTPRGLQGLVGGVISLFWWLGLVLQIIPERLKVAR